MGRLVNDAWREQASDVGVRLEMMTAEMDAVLQELADAKIYAAVAQEFEQHLVRVVEKALVIPKNTAATMPMAVAAVILKLEQGDAARDALIALQEWIAGELDEYQNALLVNDYGASRRKTLQEVLALLPAAEGVPDVRT